jgi:hypothetical protein
MSVVNTLSRAIVFGALVLAASAAFGACSGAGSPVAASPDVEFRPMPDGSVPPSDAAMDATVISTSLRIANFAPWLGAIDICVQGPGSETLMGPLISLGVSLNSDAGGGSSDGGLDAATSEDGGSDASAVHEALDGDLFGDGASREVGAVDTGIPGVGAVDAGRSDGAAAEAGETGNPSAQGLAPLTLSRPIYLRPAGTFEVAVVQGGVGSCASPYLTQQVTLDPGKSTTVVLTRGSGATPDSGLSATDGGSGSSEGVPLSLLSFTDEPGATFAAARTRFINVASLPGSDAGGAALSVAVVDGLDETGLLPLASVVDPGSAASPSSTPPVVDALGYHDGLAIDPPSLSGMVISRRAFRLARIGSPAAFAWTSSKEQLDLSVASVHTGFILAGEEDAGAFAVLWCDDGAEVPIGTPVTGCLWIGSP